MTEDAAVASVDSDHVMLLTVAYDGACFSGFAPQREGRTIHGVLSDAIRGLDPGASILRGASRTDAGVHARGQLVAVRSSRSIAPRGWVLGLNARLPDDLAIESARRLPATFDLRQAIVGKRYRYRVLRGRVRDPWLHRWAWRIDDPLDLDLARAEAAAMVGTHNFKAFRSSSDERSNTIRTISQVDVVEKEGAPFIDERFLSIVVDGTAFLHNMVRIIAGTIVDVARGRLAPGAVARTFAGGDRASLGMTAPALGLTLEEVHLGDALSDDSDVEIERWP